MQTIWKTIPGSPNYLQKYLLCLLSCSFQAFFLDFIPLGVIKKFMKPKIKYSFFCIFLACSPCAGGLTQRDIHQGVEEMFSYHVEYQEFSSSLVKRSFKLFLEQFDPYGIYLLQQEASPFWEMKARAAQEVVKAHHQGKYPFYEQMEQLLYTAIRRARILRAELGKSLLQQGVPLKTPTIKEHAFPTTIQELQERLLAHIVGMIRNEQQEEGLRELTQKDIEDLLHLIEKRFVHNEDLYTSQDHGEAFCLHVLKACAKSLDAHTCFFSPKEARELRTLLEKQFEGVGIVLREGMHGIVIKRVLEGGPAERSGLVQEGDLLLGVNERSTKEAFYEEVMDWLRGEKGERVSLLLQKSNGVRNKVSLIREKMLVQHELLQAVAIPWGEGIIGVIEVPSFYESLSGPDCEKDLQAALKSLRNQGKVLGVVLDMRKNSGGFLSQAVKVAGVFIPSGVIVVSKYAKGQMQYLREVKGKSTYNGPLVVLTSKMSASATEIVAQALQDYGLALVVGDERTFGKGTIQYQTVTDPQASSHFKVTVGRYYTVSGRSTQIEGVKADIVVPSVCQPFPIGEKYLPYALKNDQIAPAYLDPLLDIDGYKREWLEKHYLPTVQKRVSLWTEMLPYLKRHSAERLQADPDFHRFSRQINEVNSFLDPINMEEFFWGEGDFQLREAIEIVKEMHLLQNQRKAK